MEEFILALQELNEKTEEAIRLQEKLAESLEKTVATLKEKIILENRI